MRVLVIGAGPAGCTAALALSRRGHEAVLVEVEPEVAPVGVGLLLQNSPLRALHTLGLVEACVARGFVHEQIRLADAGGGVRMTIEQPSLVPGGPPAVGLSRAALAEVLLAAVHDAGIDLRVGTTVTDLDQRDDGVVVRLSTGGHSVFDLVVAADGLHSGTRALVLPEAPGPQRTGQVIWRASAPRPPEVDRYWMYDAGAELGKVGVVPISGAELYLWLLQCDRGTPRPGDLRAALRSELAPFGGHVPLVAGLLRDDVDLRSLQALLVPTPWHRGRVVVIGDAVHTTTPQVAYGVGMAIEDSVVLAETLAGPGADEVEHALTRFATRRWERCRLVVESSVQLGAWEQHPPADQSLFGALTGRTLGALAQPY